jgi:hypothetical protein
MDSTRLVGNAGRLTIGAVKDLDVILGNFEKEGHGADYKLKSTVCIHDRNNSEGTVKTSRST